MPGLTKQPDDPAPTYVHDWWTWNMAMAWVAYRAPKIVDRVGGERDDGDGFGNFLVRLGSRLEPKLEQEMLIALSGEMEDEDGSLSPEEARSQLLVAVRAGKIRVIGWRWPERRLGASKPETVPTSELEFLDYGKFLSGDEGVLARGPRVDRIGANTSSQLACYRGPRLHRGGILKAFNPHGIRVGSNKQATAAVDILVDYLVNAEGTPKKDDCLLMLRAVPFYFYDNQYNKRIWPEAVEKAGRPDLRDPGRRK